MSVDSYRVGFETSIAKKIDDACTSKSFDQGDCYSVTKNVTPVFNDNYGHIQRQKIDIGTGA